MTTIPDNFSLDTNVLIYLHDGTAPEKRAIAKHWLSNSPKLSSQVISEYLNVCRRLLKLDKRTLLSQSSGLFINCEIIPLSSNTLLYASDLIKRYDFQLFDAIIVASSIEGGCKILYSEDMQHQLTVDKQLTIINPFFKLSVLTT